MQKGGIEDIVILLLIILTATLADSSPDTFSQTELTGQVTQDETVQPPKITSTNSPITQGETFKIYGENFDTNLQLYTDGVQVEPALLRITKTKIIVPTNKQTSPGTYEIFVRTLHGESNKLQVQLLPLTQQTPKPQPKTDETLLQQLQDDYQPKEPCKYTNAKWSKTTAKEGEEVELSVIGKNCEETTIIYTIKEVDILFSDEVTTLTSTFKGDEARINWRLDSLQPFFEETFERDLEFQFTATTKQPTQQVDLLEQVEEESNEFLDQILEDLFGDFTGAAVGLSQTITSGILVVSGGTGGPQDAGATCTTISQWGITWTFDKPYECGQYINKDWWVLVDSTTNQLKITKIDPLSTSIFKQGTSSCDPKTVLKDCKEQTSPYKPFCVNFICQYERTRHGSMINPSPKDGSTQGYDSGAQDAGYSASKNVAFEVSATKPLLVPAGSSLVSTISIDTVLNRPQLDTAAILTVLSTAPPLDSFRPSYSGTDKTSYYKKSNINSAVLKKLSRSNPLLENIPSLAYIQSRVERVWLDHIPDWVGRDIHPAKNMGGYGRMISNEASQIISILNLDYTDTEKQDILIGFLQTGIDLYGVVKDGGNRNWVPNGGHASGRIGNILISGVILNDKNMQDVITKKQAFFGETSQTFIVDQTTLARTYNTGAGGYKTQHLGLPEWGIRHTTDYKRDTTSWTRDYRQCCTATAWAGEVLGFHIMGLRNLVNHNALFAYQDRYMEVETSAFRAFIPFNGEMWDAYRKNYGCVWKRDITSSTDDNGYYDCSEGTTKNNVICTEQGVGGSCTTTGTSGGKCVLVETSCTQYTNKESCEYDPCGMGKPQECRWMGSICTGGSSNKCLTYTTQTTCQGDTTCEWCAECQGNKYKQSSCAMKRQCSNTGYVCTIGKCGNTAGCATGTCGGGKFCNQATCACEKITTPGVTNVLLSPSNPATTDNLILTYNTINNPTEEILDWKIDGKSKSALNMPFAFTGKAEDYSDNNNDGAVTGALSVAGKIGGAYHFDGSDDIITIPSDPSLEGFTKITLAAWFNSDQKQSAGGGRIISKSNAATGDDYGLFMRDDSQPIFSINNNGVRTGSAISHGVWHHLVGTWDGSIKRLYLNGVQVNTEAQVASAVQDNNAGLGIGGHVDALNTRAFDGKIDQVKIYDKLLTPQQIQQMYTEENLGKHTKTIVQQETTNGQKWKVTITPIDTKIKGIVTDSNEVTIGGSGPNPPGPPSNLVATTKSATEIDLIWQDNANNEDRYIVEQDDNAQFTSPIIIAANLPPNTQTYSDTNLQPLTTYYYRVQAENTIGKSAYSNVASGTTKDNQCSGTQTRPCVTGKVGICALGTESCNAGTGKWSGICVQNNQPTPETIASGLCSDGLDNDCDGEKDWDTLGTRGPQKGDNGCPVGVTAINSATSTCPGQSITVTCTSTVANVNSVSAYIDSTQCNFIPNSWNGNDISFTCTASSSIGTQQLRCTIDTTKSYQSGVDKIATLTVGGANCCSQYTAANTCGGDTSCEWCLECQNNKYSGGTDRCVTKNTCTRACTTNQCGATCDLTSGGCTPTQTCNLNACGCTPTLTGILPLRVDISQVTTFTLEGTNFEVNPAAIVRVDGTPLKSGRVTSSALDKIEWNFEPNDYPVGKHTVTVFNPTSKLETKELIEFTVFRPKPNSPPKLDPIGNKKVVAGGTLNFKVTATDPDTGQTLTYTVTNLPTTTPVPKFKNQLFSWTPTLPQVGKYEKIKFTVTDNGKPSLSNSEEITIEVLPCPDKDGDKICDRIDCNPTNPNIGQCTGCAVCQNKGVNGLCVGNNDRCKPLRCPRQTCGLEYCAKVDELATFNKFEKRTCAVTQNVGACGPNKCTPIKCETQAACTTDGDCDGTPDIVDLCKDTPPGCSKGRPPPGTIHAPTGCSFPTGGAQFDIKTDFKKLVNILAAEEFELGKTTKAKLAIMDQGIPLLHKKVRFIPLNLDDIEVETNMVKIDTTKATKGLNLFKNKEVVITIFDLTLKNPRPLRDGKECNDCEELSYINGVFTFKATGFSTYSAGETPDTGGNNPGGGGGRGGGRGGGGSRFRTPTIDLDIQKEYTLELTRTSKVFIIYNTNKYSIKLSPNRGQRDSIHIETSPNKETITFLPEQKEKVNIDPFPEEDMEVTLVKNKANRVTLFIERIVKQGSTIEFPKPDEKIETKTDPRIQEEKIPIIVEKKGKTVQVVLVAVVVIVALVSWGIIRHRKKPIVLKVSNQKTKKQEKKKTGIISKLAEEIGKKAKKNTKAKKGIGKFK